MTWKFAAATCVTAALAMVPAPRAHADARDVILGLGLLGIGAAIANQNQGSRASASTRSTSPGMSQAQREQNRQVQRALNYFNYPVGTVDGSIGPNTRNGIRNFESAMGFTADGNLDDFERNFLLGSYQRAQTGAQVPPYSQIFAREGTQGLLRTYRDEQRGIPTPGPNDVAQPAPDQTPTPATPGLPDFGAADAPAMASLNNHCNEIQVLTNTNGGLTTLATMSDPELTMNEQFCLVRTTAVAQSANSMATISGYTDADFVQQCEGLGAYIAPQVASLDNTAPDVVQQNVVSQLESSGMTTERLRNVGVICLGIGFREDRSDVALASALIMVGIDEPAYGEVIAHHLREGFGATASPQQADVWMDLAISGLEGGATPAFLPNQSSDRIALLRAAMNGELVAPSGGGLPTFGVPAQ